MENPYVAKIVSDTSDLMDRLYQAAGDERLSTGMLYMEAATQLEALMVLVMDSEVEICELQKRLGLG